MRGVLGCRKRLIACAALRFERAFPLRRALELQSISFVLQRLAKEPGLVGGATVRATAKTHMIGSQVTPAALTMTSEHERFTAEPLLGMFSCERCKCHVGTF